MSARPVLADAAAVTPQTTERQRQLTLIWLGLLAVLAWGRMVAVMGRPIPPDAALRYLPYARRVAEEGLGFLLRPDSVHVAPLGYLWPALLGGDPYIARWVGAGLMLLCLLVVWQTARLLGGTRTALVATLLMVVHPQLYALFPTELTEPLFLTGTFVWFWGLAGMVLRSAQRGRFMVLAALGLGTSLLARPLLQFTSLALLSVAALLALWPPQRLPTRWGLPLRSAAQAVALSTVLALLPAAAVVVKNGLLFGVWSIATGSGTALYLGVQPLSLGVEPAYNGLGYDVSALVGQAPGTDGDHLHPNADRLMKALALDLLQQKSASEAVTFFARKAWWWLFQHPVPLEDSRGALRTFRMFEVLVLLVAALPALRHAFRALRRRDVVDDDALPPDLRGLVVALIAGVLLSLLAQLLLVLYNERYSVGTLEPALILLSATALAWLGRGWSGLAVRDAHALKLTLTLAAPAGAARTLMLLATLAVLVLPPVLSHQTLRRERAALDPKHLGPTQLLLSSDDHGSMGANGMTRLSSYQWRLDSSPAALVLPLTPAFVPPYTNGVWMLRFAVMSPKAKRCRHAELAYTHPVSQAASRSTLDIRSDGRMRTYAVHANGNLRPDGAGDLRIAFHCPQGTTVSWDKIEWRRSSVDTLVAQHLAPP